MSDLFDGDFDFDSSGDDADRIREISEELNAPYDPDDLGDWAEDEY